MIQNPDERLFKMIGELVGEYEDKGVFVNPTVAPIHPSTLLLLLQLCKTHHTHIRKLKKKPLLFFS